VLLADNYPNFSICGLPYFLSGDVPDWHSLAHRTIADLEQAGIELLLEHTAERIDPDTKLVTVRGHDRREQHQRYDALIVGTGAEPVRPPVPGIERDGVYQLHTIGDSLTLDAALSRRPESAVIVGAGYIGLEMAEARTGRARARAHLGRSSRAWRRAARNRADRRRKARARTARRSGAGARRIAGEARTCESTHRAGSGNA
jgi:cation diffusion facilitator CzcD-associated flavoprotein CzcO